MLSDLNLPEGFVLKMANCLNQYNDAKFLFQEYENAIGINLEFQEFNKELNNLSSIYPDDDGGILILYYGEVPAACIALKRIDESTGEIKRLYVQKEFRKFGFGRVLVKSCIHLAKEKGYHLLKLDTLSSMHAAIALYKSFGFHETEPYRFNPFEDAMYFELRLEC